MERKLLDIFSRFCGEKRALARPGRAPARGVVSLAFVVSGGVSGAGAVDVVDLMQPPIVIVTQDRLLAAPLDLAQTGEKHSYLNEPPPEPDAPFFELDWSLALRGSYSAGTGKGTYAVSLVPRFSASREGLRSRYGFSAEATFGVNSDQLTRIEQVLLSASGQYALDSVTQVTGQANLSIRQDDPNAPGTSDQIVQAPIMASGDAEIAVARQFGRFGVMLSGEVARETVGDTVLVGDVFSSNTDQNRTQVGVRLRGEYEITPIFSTFIEGALSRDWFDAAPISTGIKQDGWETSVSGGLVANWRNVWQGQVSSGYGVRKYYDSSLAELASALYAFDLTYVPNEALALSAGITTTLNPANVSASIPASVDYGFGADVDFLLADWVGLRASISQTVGVPVNGDPRTLGFSSGVGANFNLGKNTALSLDYTYTSAQSLPAAAQYAHTVAFGLIWSR